MFQNVLVHSSGSVTRKWLCDYFAKTSAAIVRLKPGAIDASLMAKLRPDLVVLDNSSAKSRFAWDACRDLKTDAKLNTIPVLMLLGQQSIESRVQEIEVAADSFVRSPYAEQDFCKHLEELAEIRRQHGRRGISYEIRIFVHSNPEYLDPFCRLFGDLWFIGKFPARKGKHLIMAVRELCMNAIEWGHKKQQEHLVTVNCQTDADKVIVNIQDKGPGFDPSKLPHAANRKDPTYHMNIREEQGIREGGFGIMMARSLVDEVVYNDTGNEVRLTKYFPK